MTDKEMADNFRTWAGDKAKEALQIRKQIAELTQQADALEKKAWAYRNAAQCLDPNGQEEE